MRGEGLRELLAFLLRVGLAPASDAVERELPAVLLPASLSLRALRAWPPLAAAARRLPCCGALLPALAEPAAARDGVPLRALVADLLALLADLAAPLLVLLRSAAVLRRLLPLLRADVLRDAPALLRTACSGLLLVDCRDRRRELVLLSLSLCEVREVSLLPRRRSSARLSMRPARVSRRRSARSPTRPERAAVRGASH